MEKALFRILRADGLIKTIFTKLALVFLALSGVLVVLFQETLAGTWALRLSRWHEEQYVGQRLAALRAELERHGVDVRPSDKDSLLGQTGRRLNVGEQAFVFRHGPEYSWFLVGRAVNIGYVVSRQEQGHGIVVAILRARQVDAP